MATSGGSFNQDSWNRWKTRLEGKLHFCSLLKKTSEKALSYDDGSCNTLNFQPQKLSFDFDSHSTAVEVTQKFRIQCKRGNSLSPLKKTNFHLFEGPRFSLGRISRWRVVHAPLHFDAFSFCKIQRWAKKVCPRLPDGIAQPRASFFGHLWTFFSSKMWLLHMVHDLDFSGFSSVQWQIQLSIPSESCWTTLCTPRAAEAKFRWRATKRVMRNGQNEGMEG